jgi:hypothetical protein
VSLRLTMLAILLVACTGEAPRAWIDRALTVNQTVDQDLARGDLAAARRALVGLVEGDVPRGVAADDRRIVLQDAYARLAAVELAADRPADGLAWTDRGLALGDAGDVFAASLYLTRGRACERLGRDPAAVEAYARALAIDERLLDQALGDQPKETP